MSEWTDERVALLKKWWADGLTQGQIARKLKGVTPSAVGSKVHRLGLPMRQRALKEKLGSGKQ